MEINKKLISLATIRSINGWTLVEENDGSTRRYYFVKGAIKQLALEEKKAS